MKSRLKTKRGSKRHMFHIQQVISQIKICRESVPTDRQMAQAHRDTGTQEDTKTDKQTDTQTVSEIFGHNNTPQQH